MKLSSRFIAWLLVVLWFAWVHALQERMSVSELLGVVTPDLGMVLFVGLLAAVKKEDIFLLAVLAAIGRKSFSIDSSLAILCGFLALAWIASLLRHMVELSSPLWRAVITGVGALGLALWLDLVRFVRVGSTGPDVGTLVPLAVSSAMVALAIGGLAIYLPGLSPLRRRAW